MFIFEILHLLRTFAPIATAYPYCARKFPCIKRALSTKMNNDRTDGNYNAIALLGFNDLGRSVTPTFSFPKQIFFFTVISTLSKNEKKINVES